MILTSNCPTFAGSAPILMYKVIREEGPERDTCVDAVEDESHPEEF